MTFKQAYEKMKGIAAGRYFCLYYEIHEHSDSQPEASCRLYLDSKISHDPQPTWEEAFKALDAEMHPKPKLAPNMEEAPE